MSPVQKSRIESSIVHRTLGTMAPPKNYKQVSMAIASLKV